MSDTFPIPDVVVEAIVEEGEPAEKAFREHAGIGVAALAESTLIPAARLEEIERGATPTADEIDAIGEALGVPADLLID